MWAFFNRCTLTTEIKKKTHTTGHCPRRIGEIDIKTDKPLM